MIATISPQSLADLRRRGEPVALVDVRTPAESSARCTSSMPATYRSTGAATCSKTAMLLAAVILAGGTMLAAEHTKESLDTIRGSVAAGQAVLLDVREPDEWQEGHVAGARLLPLSTLEGGLSADQLARVLPKDRIIYCHCLAGGRCLQAADILRPFGYDVRPMKQGYPALVKAGFPTATGK